MLAHLVQTGFGGFYDGVAHWALTPRDVMVTIALAFLGGLGGLAPARSAVVVLPVAWLLGGLVGFQFSGLGELGLATAISVGVIGLLVAWGRPLPRGVVAFAALAGGLLHGVTNGSVMMAEGRERLTLFGVVAAVALVTLLAAAGVASLQKPAARVVVRVAGSWIAAIALLLLGWQFRPA